MGVKDFWTVASPIGELECVSSLSGQIVAIDLSCWICDSQTGQMGKTVVRPHLRNLFFRTTTLISSGIIPIFVIEGEAPELKLTTMQNRSKGQFGHSKKSVKRSRFKGILSQCCELLDYLGIPWVQAKGEAEATCAALNYFKIADCVVTQDSDTFLYGAKCVLKNFSANKQKPSFDKFTLDKLERTYGLTRDIMIVMGVLLGCDYLPGGVHGIGKEVFLQLIKYWRTIGVNDPIKRFKEWGNMEEPKLAKDKKNVEDVVRRKTTTHPNYPFEDVINEFKQKIDKPKVIAKWAKPNFMKLIKYLNKMLDWELSYCIEKSVPIMTLWMINNQCKIPNLKIERIIKRRICQGVPSLEVEWTLLDDLNVLGLDYVNQIRTKEHEQKFTILFPEEVSYFNDFILKAKKTKKTSKLKRKQKNILPRKKMDEFYPMSDDSIDEKDLSAVINRLINLKVDDEDTKKEKYAEIILISDDDENHMEKKSTTSYLSNGEEHMEKQSNKYDLCDSEDQKEKEWTIKSDLNEYEDMMEEQHILSDLSDNEDYLEKQSIKFDLSDDLFDDLNSTISSYKSDSNIKLNSSIPFTENKPPARYINSNKLALQSFLLDETININSNSANVTENEINIYTNFFSNSINVPDMPNFKILNTPNLSSNQIFSDEETAQNPETPKQSHVKNSFTIDTPKISLIERIRQRYGNELGMSLKNV